MFCFFQTEESDFEQLLKEFLWQEEKISQARLHNIMTALRGQDRKIKSQIAFAIFKKNLPQSFGKGLKIVTLKQLIIYDLMVEQNIFCAEIAKINLDLVEIFQEQYQNTREKSEIILQLFWKIIKSKSIIMSAKEHILHQKRSQRHFYAFRLTPEQAISQLGTLQILCEDIFNLLDHIKNLHYTQTRQMEHWKKMGITKYLLLHLLYKLIYLHSSQMVIQNVLFQKITEISRQTINKLRRTVLIFRDFSNKFKSFLKQNHNLKQINNLNYQQINPEVSDKALKFIDNYLHQTDLETNQPILHQIPIFSTAKLNVQIKPASSLAKSTFTPRIFMKNSKEHSKQQNSFLSWQNSYSYQFPQKQIMSIDLILQIKLEESLKKETEEQCEGQYHENTIYLWNNSKFDNRSTYASSSYSVNFFKIKKYQINTLEPSYFPNLFSNLTAQWNGIQN